MCGATCFAIRKMPRTLTAMTRSHSSTSISANGCSCSGANSAALLTRMSILPKRAIVVPTSSITDASSLTSTVALVTELAPSVFAISAASALPSAMSAIITRALAGERLRVVPADALGAARHDGDAAVQSCHLRNPLACSRPSQPVSIPLEAVSDDQQKRHRAEKDRADHDGNQQPAEVDGKSMLQSGARAMDAKVGHGVHPAGLRLAGRQTLIVLESTDCQLGSQVPSDGPEAEPSRPQGYDWNEHPGRYSLLGKHPSGATRVRWIDDRKEENAAEHDCCAVGGADPHDLSAVSLVEVPVLSSGVIFGRHQRHRSGCPFDSTHGKLSLQAKRSNPAGDGFGGLRPPRNDAEEIENAHHRRSARPPCHRRARRQLGDVARHRAVGRFPHMLACRGRHDGDLV